MLIRWRTADKFGSLTRDEQQRAWAVCGKREIAQTQRGHWESNFEVAKGEQVGRPRGHLDRRAPRWHLNTR